jgi:aspartate kinase
VCERPDEREQDVVAASGEQVSIGLLALAIQGMGGKARSFTGHQVAIHTDSAYAKARILSIDRQRIDSALLRGEIAIVAGFQGEDEAGNLTTLGRGGSDTTAVAIAAAIGASACEIYTDVEGVYTTDPAIVPAARKLDRISYEAILELASAGAKVLQIRSVELAMKYRVPLWVKSSFTDAAGTLCCEEDPEMERAVVSGIAYDRNEAKLVVRGIPDRPGVAARIFKPLADSNIVVDLIVQNVGHGGKANLTFTVPRSDLPKALDIVKRSAAELGADAVESDEGIVKVSVVGVGMRNHAGVAAKAFEVLAAAGINIEMISTSEIKISVVIAQKFMELAIRELHAAFGLDAPSPR